MSDLDIITDLNAELETNPDYSLKVDPTKKYRMTKSQKEFIQYYIEFMSIPLACELANIDINEGKEYYTMYSTQQEIRRINKAKYLRQFNTKMLSLKELGGYLTSIITDNNTSHKDNIKIGDKLKSAQMLIDINKFMNESTKDPSMIINCDVNNIEKDIKQLSVKSIKSLISSAKNTDITEQVIDNTMSVEEEAYIKSLPVDKLLKTIEQLNKDKENNEK